MGEGAQPPGSIPRPPAPQSNNRGQQRLCLLFLIPELHYAGLNLSRAVAPSSPFSRWTKPPPPRCRGFHFFFPHSRGLFHAP